MYRIYIAGTVMPLAPEKITYKIKNRNEVKTLIDGSEITIPKKVGLTEISFSLRLPGKRLPFAIYDYNRFMNPLRYLDLFDTLKNSGKPFMLDIARLDDKATEIYQASAITQSSSIVRVGADGKAPPGLLPGTQVVTAGGVWQISAVNPDGSYQSHKVADSVNVQSNGKAPKGLKAGTYVVTAGGLYKITAVNRDGSYQSVKVSDDIASVRLETQSDSTAVTLEDYTVEDRAEDGDDIIVNLTFRQWRYYATQYVAKENGRNVLKSVGGISLQAAVPYTYMTQQGDTLTGIAKRFFNDSTQWENIYQMNQDTIEQKAKDHGYSSSVRGSRLFPNTILKLQIIPEEDTDLQNMRWWG